MKPMRINWKVRFKSKSFWIGIIGIILGFVFHLLGQFGLLNAFTEGIISELITLVLSILGALGVIIDPTTQGMCDSDRVMEYKKPI